MRGQPEHGTPATGETLLVIGPDWLQSLNPTRRAQEREREALRRERRRENERKGERARGMGRRRGEGIVEVERRGGGEEGRTLTEPRPFILTSYLTKTNL